MQSKKRPRHSKEFKKEVIQKVNDGVKRSKVTKEYGILPGTLSKWIRSSKCKKDDTDEAKSLLNMYNDIDDEMRGGEVSERNVSEKGSDVDADEYESEDGDDTEDGEMNCGEAENYTDDEIEDEVDGDEMRGGDEDTDEYESEDQDDGMIGGEIEKNKQITNKKSMNCQLTKTKIFEKCIAQFFKDIFHNVPDLALKISKPPITKKPEPDLMQMTQMYERRKKWKRMWEMPRRKRRKRRGKYIYV